jgi:predicted membrane-bound mannosyltransferase
MVFSPLVPNLCWTGLDLLAATQRLARGFGKNDRGDATLRRGLLKKRRCARRILFPDALDFFAIGMNRFRLKA